VTTPLLPFIPEQSGYSVSHPDQVVSVELDGGAPRLRADKLFASGSASVTWFLDRAELATFLAFIRQDCARGALPFLIDIITESHLLLRHRVTLTPGSLRTVQVNGLTYKVSAELRHEQLACTGGVMRFISPNEIQALYATDFNAFLLVGDPIQLAGAQVVQAGQVPLELDGVYQVASIPSVTHITLTAPGGQWPLIAAYPGAQTNGVSGVVVARTVT
jgi:hypothetical protein